jgi:hypothetical protein
MGFADYHFVTHWKVTAPIRTVFEILKDGESYALWWQPAYRQSRVVGENKVRCLVRAKLPYTLDFTTELIREKAPTELEIKATGELAGKGLWKLKQVGEITDIEFYWDVRAEKPWVRLLSPFLKKVFRWNHDWVMAVGEKGLQSEVSGSHRQSRRFTHNSRGRDA